jgi:hypothetical protein
MEEPPDRFLCATLGECAEGVLPALRILSKVECILRYREKKRGVAKTVSQGIVRCKYFYRYITILPLPPRKKTHNGIFRFSPYSRLDRLLARAGGNTLCRTSP